MILEIVSKLPCLQNSIGILMEKGGSFPKVKYPSNDIDSVLESFEGTYTISAEILCLSLGAMILDTPILHQSNNTAKDKRDYEDMYFTVSAVKAKYFT